MAPRTTIACTVGPACREVEVLARMVQAGADVFRLNGAHVEAPDLADWIARIRSAGAAAGREVGVLLDLPGTKFRVGKIGGEGRFAIAPGQRLRIDASEAPGSHERIPVRSVTFFEEVAAGSAVVLGDGRERLVVRSADARGLDLEVVEGGEVESGMGIHFPGIRLPTSVPTKRDRELLKVGVAAGIDMVAQSFVRNEDDVARLKEELAERGAKHVLAIAKIERLEALDNLERIVDRADAVIVARGDLGIDVGVENVPSQQRRILGVCLLAARPVIVATEMLESMTRELRPTRAEASDVAGAVFEGADAVMLSGETAIGAHPVRVVETMDRILEAAEADPSAPYAGSARRAGPALRPGRPDQHVVRAAVDLARDTGAKAIVVFTRQGSSAIRLSKERPHARIHAFTSSPEAARRLALAWGVRPAVLGGGRSTDEILQLVTEHLRGPGGLVPGDRAVVVMGSLKDPAGATTLIKLVHL